MARYNNIFLSDTAETYNFSSTQNQVANYKYLFVQIVNLIATN